MRKRVRVGYTYRKQEGDKKPQVIPEGTIIEVTKEEAGGQMHKLEDVIEPRPVSMPQRRRVRQETKENRPIRRLTREMRPPIDKGE